MSLFAKPVSAFLNSTQNPEQKYKDINTSISILYTALLKGELSLPTLDSEYSSLLDVVDGSYQNIFTSLSQSVLVDGKIQRQGYSPAKIASSVTGNPKELLDQVGDDYQNILLELNQIYLRLNKSFHYHKLLQYLFGDLISDFTSKLDLTKFSYTTNSFSSIFRQDPCLNLPEQDIVTIPYIFSYVYLFKLYNQSFRFPSDFLMEVYQTDSFSDQRIANEFLTYLDTSKSIISSELSQYILNNIFLFGTNVASEITDVLETTISELLLEFKNVFLSIKDEVITTDFIFSLSYDVLYHLITHTSLKYINETDGSLNDVSFYDNILNFWQITGDDLAYYAQQDDVVFKRIYDYLNFNISIFKELHIISVQFVETPLFFLNAYIVTFAQMALNYIQEQSTDFETITLSEVKSWTEKFFNLQDNADSSILNYISSHRFNYPEDMPYYIKISCFLRFRDFIVRLFDHESVKNWLIKRFIPVITKKINEMYFIEVDWYKYIDHLTSFLKCLLMKHLIDTDSNTNLPILFGSYVSDFDTNIQSYFQSTDLLATVGAVKSLNIAERQNYSTYYAILNSFFKSAAIAKYLERHLQDSYSL